MKKIIFLSILVFLAYLFYPNVINSSSSGSPGGKTGSPTDGASCNACHYAGNGNQNNISITSNIPSDGYTPNEIYSITATINQSGTNKFGFEITSEEGNLGSSKAGTFIITNTNETKLVNNNTAVTHKSSGNTGINNTKSWTFDWQAPNAGIGNIIFYAAFLGTNEDGTNSGDILYTKQINFEESNTNSTNNMKEEEIVFNSINKLVETNQIANIKVYTINGSLITESKNTNSISLKNLKPGIYLINATNLKGKQKTKKININ